MVVAISVLTVSNMMRQNRKSSIRKPEGKIPIVRRSRGDEALTELTMWDLRFTSPATIFARRVNRVSQIENNEPPHVGSYVTGNRTVKVVPVPVWLATSIVPP